MVLHNGAYGLLREARQLIEEHRPERAVTLLEMAKTMEPGRGSILEALGVAYYNSGDHHGARKEFEEALDVDPTNHFARYGLSRCLYKQGLLKRAIGQAKLANAMAPGVEMYEEALQRYQGELDFGVED